MEREKINLAFIRLEIFLEQCVALKGPDPPPIPTPESAKNIKNELVYLLENDDVSEINCDQVSSVTEVLTYARTKHIPGVIKHSEEALREYKLARSEFIRRVDANIPTVDDDLQRKDVIPKTSHHENVMSKWRENEDRNRRAAEITSKLNNNNPNITDLSDMNRPTKIVDRFCRLYDNEWSDAFEELEKMYKHDIRGDERAIVDLATILKKAFEFAEEMVEIQRTKIAKAMKHLMANPSKEENIPKDNDMQTPDEHSDFRFALHAKQCIKENASLSVSTLRKNFAGEIRRERFRDSLQIPLIKTYCDKCVELTWLMNVQDPPMVLIWPQAVQRDHMAGMFRNFTKTGSILNYEVWPAVMLTKEGPLMVKGVAQFK